MVLRGKVDIGIQLAFFWKSFIGKVTLRSCDHSMVPAASVRREEIHAILSLCSQSGPLVLHRKSFLVHVLNLVYYRG